MTTAHSERLSPGTADAARAVINAGLTQRFGVLRENDTVVATGALVRESSRVVRVTRMSVAAHAQGRGLGGATLRFLLTAPGGRDTGRWCWRRTRIGPPHVGCTNGTPSSSLTSRTAARTTP